MGRKNIEAIYPLSPSQQGILFETLSASVSGIHIEQFSCSLRGNLDLLAFEHAWQRVVEQHAILRTAFVWKGQDEPLQVVLEQVKVPLDWQDWTSFSSSRQQEKLGAYLKTDRLRGFKLAKAPLMRLALFRTNENESQLIQTNHHILFDGWSRVLILKEFLTLYEAFSIGHDLSLKPSRPYKDYIDWLIRQDLSAMEEFWRKSLQGFRRPTPLGVKAESSRFTGQENRYGKQKALLPMSAILALNTTRIRLMSTPESGQDLRGYAASKRRAAPSFGETVLVVV